MAFDRAFANAIVTVMGNEGWIASLPEGDLPNPLHIRLSKDRQTRILVVYARRITRQSRSGPDPSTHNRPEGEMHAQMIFDDSKRGAGIRNFLHFSDDAQTLVLGYFEADEGYVVAAYDPERHREYAYSKSLQVKWRTLQQAFRTGMAFQRRSNGEVIVAFEVNEFPKYLDNAHEWHTLTADSIEELKSEAPEQLKPVFEQPDDATSLLPVLEVEERRQKAEEIVRYIRDYRFAQGIRSLYERCAICGFQYDYVLDAAHIVPVAEGGTDTYENGLGLCPNCHRMFDRGMILVDETGKIYLNPHYVEEYQDIGRADSLEHLQRILRDTLWLPDDPQYRPSSKNLRKTFGARKL